MGTENLEGQAYSIPEILRRQAAQAPDAVALLSPGGPRVTFGQLRDQARAMATALHARGIERSDRVAIVLPNGPDMALAFLGVTSAAVAAPLNPACKTSEFEFYLSDLRVSALVALPGPHPCREAAAAVGVRVVECEDLLTGTGVAPEDPQPASGALVLHTSGTTSRPKLVPLTHANLCRSAAHVAAALDLTQRDRCLNVMPLFHIHGLIAGLLAGLSRGGSVAATPGFVSGRWELWLDECQPTWYTAVPTIHQAVLSVLGPTTRAGRWPLRLIRSSSSALPPAVMAGLEQVFGVPVIEAYGMTEAAHQMSSNNLPPGVRKPGSVGRAAGPEVAIMDAQGSLLGPGREGEVVIRGPNVTSGYENNPEANAQAFTAGWFRTGDLGRLDPDGYLYLTGRLKEIINRGGEKIAPKEVEHGLLEHPAVAEAVAFPVPHTSLGEDVAAAVVLRAGSAVTPAELRQFAAARLASFKVPSRIVLVTEIPKNATGKIQRTGLAETLGLLAPGLEDRQPAAAYVAPRTPIEQKLADIWAGVLRVERVGVMDDFTQIGGDSLLAAQLLTHIAEAFGLDDGQLALDAASTIAEMARHLDTADVRPGE